jgi:hypothetical protein
MKLKRLLLLTAGTVLFTIGLSVSATPGCSQAMSCGIELVPLKPLPPLGCSDLKRECVCDTSKTPAKCGWAWVCVK